MADASAREPSMVIFHELEAIEKGLKIAIDLQLNRVLVATDSIQAVHYIADARDVPFFPWVWGCLHK